MADIIKRDIIDIELNGGSIHRSFACNSIGLSDTLANRFGVRLFRDGYDVAIGESGSVEGFFLPPQGSPILIRGDTYTGVNGNVAWVQLPQACYTYDGVFTLAIKVIDGGITSTMRIVDGIVDNTHTGGVVAPLGTVPTYQEILSLYETMQGAITAAQHAADYVAGAYDDTQAYAIGDYCIHDGAMYRCTTEIPEGGETWTAAHWTQTSAGDELHLRATAADVETMRGQIVTLLVGVRNALADEDYEGAIDLIDSFLIDYGHIR